MDAIQYSLKNSQEFLGSLGNYDHLSFYLRSQFPNYIFCFRNLYLLIQNSICDILQY